MGNMPQKQTETNYGWEPKIGAFPLLLGTKRKSRNILRQWSKGKSPRLGNRKLVRFTAKKPPKNQQQQKGMLFQI